MRRRTRIGPEKGVIHIATGAVDNALWDLYARARQKPLWKLLVDMSSVRPGLRRVVVSHIVERLNLFYRRS